jgi:hypothetical protein
MFTVTAHCVSPPPRQIRLPSPILLVLSDMTAASRAARCPAPATRQPPAPTPTARQRPSDSACARRRPSGRRHSLRRHASPLLLLRLFRASFGIDACRSADAHCSPRAGQNHRAVRTRASRPPALHVRASRRPCRPPARPPAPHHSDRLAPSRAARPRWVRLTTPRSGRSLQCHPSMAASAGGTDRDLAYPQFAKNCGYTIL